MNISSEYPTLVNETSILQSPDDHTKILVIIFSITIPMLASLILLIILIICYRRRLTKLLENSNRLQSLNRNLSTNSFHQPYSQKKRRFSHRQFLHPRTETIVYNQLSTPSTPVINNLFQSSTQGEINPAFNEYIINNDIKPILQESTTIFEQHFPSAVQTPVPTITSEFVQAIATHRRTLHTDTNNTSLNAFIPPSSIHRSQQSIAPMSHSNASPTLLLFSQRTLF